MKVYGTCKKCKKDIVYTTQAGTRVEFAMYEAAYKILNCNDCGGREKYHVDDLFAKESKIAKILALATFLVGMPLLFYGFGYLYPKIKNQHNVFLLLEFLLLPTVVYGIIKKQEEIRVSSFNRLKLKA